MKRIIKNIIFVIALCLLLFAGSLYVIPGLIGWKSMAVQSASMAPKIPLGSLIVNRPVDTSDLQVGDIVTYRMGPETYVTHRIVAVDMTNSTVVTKGDANEVADMSPVAMNAIVGRVVVTVPFLGFVSIYGGTVLGRTFIFAIVFALIMLAVLPGVFVSDGTDRKKEKQVDKTENDNEEE